jgi:RNA polymerase sigma factor (sigma-70 family)
MADNSAMTHKPTAFVIDDDPLIRESLVMLLRPSGVAVQTFAEAEGYLAVASAENRGCLVLDVSMPGMSGPELQAELARRNIRLPIIYLSGCEEVSLATQVIRVGAMDYLTKPVDPRLLIDRVRAAFAQDEREHANAALRQRFSELTEREREVLALLMRGYSNKEVARQLGISHRTVEMHRSNILMKTDTANLLDLARLADACELPSAREEPPVPGAGA